MKVYQNGVDTGYLDDPNWWLNPDHPYAYLINPIDDNYTEEYFKEDHVGQDVVNAVYENVCKYYKLLTGDKLKNIVEFGCGGGWFLDKFKKNGVSEFGVEGSMIGLLGCKNRGIFACCYDLRNTLHRVDDKYNAVICTEMAEHIEIPFSGALVSSLTNFSDFVWFSSEGSPRPHIHHPNQQPLKFWISLFDYYGYGHYMLPDEVNDACEKRGRVIFFNKSKPIHLP